jgi:thiol:disulfide interchange protein DsbA
MTPQLKLLNKLPATLVYLCTSLIGLIALTAQAEDYEVGVHYEQLLIPVVTQDPAKIEVVEMFSYMCVHCFNFDATVSEWARRQSSDVDFRREPAIFNKSWELMAQAFYASKALGVTDKTHDAMFEAIHTRNEDMRAPEKMAALFNRTAGVVEADFMRAFNSFSVRSKVQQADTRGRQYRVAAVPTLVVNGKYKVDGRMAGSNTGMLRIADYLIKKELAARAAPVAQSSAAQDAAASVAR